MHDGLVYPVKPLGRLANKLADNPLTDNPTTTVFRKYFENLGFQLIDTPDNEAENAAKRQRRLAEIWERPEQAKFRRAVFERYNARCIVTGCGTLISLEAAHILPVSEDGGDASWNGIPLRADIHRLFDAGAIKIKPKKWKVFVGKELREEYGRYHGIDLEPVFAKLKDIDKTADALNKRNRS